MNKQLEFRKILNACSFGALVLIAIILLVNRLNVLPPEINGLLIPGAALLGFIVCGASATMFVVTKRKAGFWIVFGVALMFVLILTILNLVKPVV